MTDDAPTTATESQDDMTALDHLEAAADKLQARAQDPHGESTPDLANATAHAQRAAEDLRNHEDRMDGGA